MVIPAPIKNQYFALCALCVLLTILAAKSLSADDRLLSRLPPEVQFDFYMTQILDSIKNNNDALLLAKLEEMEKNIGFRVSGDLLFFKARAELQAGDVTSAKNSISLFLDDENRESKFWRDGLSLSLDIDEFQANKSENLNRARGVREEIAALERDLVQIRKRLDDEELQLQGHEDELKRSIYALNDRYRYGKDFCNGNWTRAAAYLGVKRIISFDHCEDLFRRRDEILQNIIYEVDISRMTRNRSREKAHETRQTFEEMRRSIAAKWSEVSMLEGRP